MRTVFSPASPGFHSSSSSRLTPRICKDKKVQCFTRPYFISLAHVLPAPHREFARCSGLLLCSVFLSWVALRYIKLTPLVYAWMHHDICISVVPFMYESWISWYDSLSLSLSLSLAALGTMNSGSRVLYYEYTLYIQSCCLPAFWVIITYGRKRGGGGGTRFNAAYVSRWSPHAQDTMCFSSSGRIYSLCTSRSQQHTVHPGIPVGRRGRKRNDKKRGSLRYSFLSAVYSYPL